MTRSHCKYYDSFYGPEPQWNGLLGAGDFPRDDPVIVNFEDGSLCSFRYAFYRREKGEPLGRSSVVPERLVVYTEHCGYHSFPAHATPVVGADYTEYETPKELRQAHGLDD